MPRTSAFLKTSLLLSAGSLFVALVSSVLGHQVDYLDHLGLFNVMAAAMLALSVAALWVGVVGTWKARGRSASLWIANVAALMVSGFYLLNP